MMITWKHNEASFTAPWSLDNKIEIFETRVFGWQLHQADLMANGGTDLHGKATQPIADSGFAVLQICLSYFEMIAKYRDGIVHTRQSGTYFKKGIGWVFPQFDTATYPAMEPLLDKLFEGGRCGLYHASMTHPGIAVRGGTADSIVLDAPSNHLLLNPHKLPIDLKAHLNSYVTALRDTTQTILRTAFETRFDSDNGIVTIAGFTPAPAAVAPVSGARAPSATLGASGVAPGTAPSL